MKKSLTFGLALLVSILTSCRNEPVAPATPDAPARTVQEAQARLTAQPKWTIDEAFVDGQLIHKRGQTDPAVSDIELEWCRFTNDGIFEVKTLGDPTIEKIYYKLDQVNNRLVISYDEAFETVENWTIKTGSVYADKFEMEQTDGDALLLKMVPAP